MEGQLDIYLGPMFSGKTSRLLQILSLYADLGYKVAYINSSLDTRGENISPHNSLYKENGKFSGITKIKAILLKEIYVEPYDIIGVDEAQFFADVVEVVSSWVNVVRKIVTVVALDGTSEMKPFGRVMELIPVADNVEKLKAKCMKCRKEGKFIDAGFTKCLEEIKSKDGILIGGADKFMAVCRRHYFED